MIDDWKIFETGGFPDSVTIGEDIFYFNTDFRIWLKFDRIRTLEEITNDAVRFYRTAFQLCIDHSKSKEISSYEELSSVYTSLFPAINWFYSLANENNPFNREPDEGRKRQLEMMKEDADKQPIAFSFYHDAVHLWGAFKSKYNIDLYKENMHWWEFVALFRNLPGGTYLDYLKMIRTAKQKDFIPPKKQSESAIASKQRKEWDTALTTQFFLEIPKVE